MTREDLIEILNIMKVYVQSYTDKGVKYYDKNGEINTYRNNIKENFSNCAYSLLSQTDILYIFDTFIDELCYFYPNLFNKSEKDEELIQASNLVKEVDIDIVSKLMSNYSFFI